MRGTKEEEEKKESGERDEDEDGLVGAFHVVGEIVVVQVSHQPHRILQTLRSKIVEFTCIGSCHTKLYLF